MHKIEYEIKLNDEGRPYVDLPTTAPSPELKFLALEMSRYILQTTHSRMTSPPFDQHTIDEMDRAIRLLGQISDEVARILWHQMKASGEMVKMIGLDVHVVVKTIGERDAIDHRGILCGENLYVREEGLKVLVTECASIYELQNDNWVEINKSDDDEKI